QVARLLALEDAINIAGRALVLVDVVGLIGNQAADADVMGWRRRQQRLAKRKASALRQASRIRFESKSLSRSRRRGKSELTVSRDLSCRVGKFLARAKKFFDRCGS